MRVTPAQVQARIRDATQPRPVRILKAEQERRYVLGLAYGPDRLDGHGEYMTPQTVEDAAWGFLQDGGRQIGVQHTDGTTGVADVVESYVYRGPDWVITDSQGNTQTIRAGDWLLGAVFDDPTWRAVRAGKLTGWSIDGAGKRRTVAKREAGVT